jgi:hypothetical protein
MEGVCWSVDDASVEREVGGRKENDFPMCPLFIV